VLHLSQIMTYRYRFMSKRLQKHRIVGHTGGGDHKNNHWPHPLNEEFNNIMRRVVKIYGIGSIKDSHLLKECRDYLISRINLLIDHKVRRDTEEYYKVMKIEVLHGFNKGPAERQAILQDSDMLLCVGDWRLDSAAIQEYKFATSLGIPKYEMRYDSAIPIENIFRYLQPVRPIKDTEWDSTKQDNVLIYESAEGHLELMDGNHRHEFANRLGTVESLSGWIIKEV
jgi:hypothetical protein